YRLVRQVRNAHEQPVALGLGSGQLVLERLQPYLDVLHLLDLLGRRLAARLLPPAKLVHLRDEGAPAFVRGEKLVERGGRTPPRQRGPEALGSVARCAEGDRARETMKASLTSSTEGQTKSAIARTCGCAFATATP